MSSRHDYCEDWLQPECAGCTHLRRWISVDETPIEECAVTAYALSVIVPLPQIRHCAPRPSSNVIARADEIRTWRDGDVSKRPCPVRTTAAK